MLPPLQLAAALAKAQLVSALIVLPGGPVPLRSAPWVVISVEFPDRISVAAGNYLEVYDPHGQLAQRLP